MFRFTPLSSDKTTKNNGWKCIEAEAENCALLVATIGITIGIRKKGVTADNWPVRLHSVKTRGQSAARNLTLLLPSNSRGWKSRSNAGTILRTFYFCSQNFILFCISWKMNEDDHFETENCVFVLEYIIYYLNDEMNNIPVHSTIFKRKWIIVVFVLYRHDFSDV